MIYTSNMNYVGYMTDVSYMYFVSYMNWVKFSELCRLLDYFMNHLESLEITQKIS